MREDWVVRLAITANQARTVAGPSESAAILAEPTAMRSAPDVIGVALPAEQVAASVAGSLERTTTVRLAATTRAVQFLT